MSTRQWITRRPKRAPSAGRALSAVPQGGQCWSNSASCAALATFMGILVVLLVVTSETLRSALAISGDEGFEVTKALLWTKGYALYDQVWNNQPPLHTVLLGLLFKLLGPDIGAARGLALCFGLLLVSGCFTIVRRRWGMLAAYVAAASLITAPEVLKLSLAAMLEVPAFAVAAWSLAALRSSSLSSRPMTSVLFSACLMAVALQIKFTAGLIAPAICTEVIALTCREIRPATLAKACVPCGYWIVTTVAVFLGLSLLLGGSYEQMVASLFSPRLFEYVNTQETLAFSPSVWFDHPEGIAGTLLGLTALVLSEEKRSAAFAAVFLATVTGVHLVHRPYWSYYYVHFAIPMAFLTGFGAAKASRIVLMNWRDSSLSSQFRFAGALASGSVVLWLLVHDGGRRAVEEIERIAALPRATDSQLVLTIRKYQPRTVWAYSRDPVCTFHGGLLLIPDLAVLPDNRFWSGRINHVQVWETVRRYRPEQILLIEEVDADTQDFLSTNYVKIYEDTDHRLYVARALVIE